MPVPKTKAESHSERQAQGQLEGRAPTYSECPQCHQPKLPHRVCANCGYYAGRQAIEVE